MKLVCYSGDVEANIGDKFRDRDAEWEIVSFPPGGIYSPSSLGGAPTVRCKPLTEIPSWWKTYMLEDGTCDWCGDSVAAMMLTKDDGKPRSARGDMLRAVAPTSNR